MFWFLLIIALIVLGFIFLPQLFKHHERNEVVDVVEQFPLTPLETSILRDIRRQNPTALRPHILYLFCRKPIRPVVRTQIANEIIDDFPERSEPYQYLAGILQPPPSNARQHALNDLDELYRARQQAPPPSRKVPLEVPTNPFETPPEPRFDAMRGHDFDVFDFLDNIEILRQINALHVFERQTMRRRTRHVYENAQNVHALSRECQEKAYKLVQKYKSRATREAIESESSLLLLNAPLATTEVISSTLERILGETTKYGYREEKFTTPELFFAVVMYIKTEAPEETRTELQKRLYEELAEANKQCGTGHVVRLLNVLSGFGTEYQMKLSLIDEVYARVSILAQREIERSPDVDEILEDKSIMTDFLVSKQGVLMKELLDEYKGVATDGEIRAAITEALNRYTKTTRFN